MDIKLILGYIYIFLAICIIFNILFDIFLTKFKVGDRVI